MHWLTIPYKEEDNCILLLYNKKYSPSEENIYSFILFYFHEKRENKK
jgi:hypothetical protein